MVYVKAAIVTILVLIGVLVGYMFVAFDANHELHLAGEAFLKGQYEQAQHDLSKLEGRYNAEQIDLYQAYVARALNNLERSQKLLTSAAVAAEKHRQPELFLEIRLNQALNAYLMHDNEALKNAVTNAAREYPNQPWVIFFQGLLNYQMGNYSKAAELWSIANERVPLSSWMKKTFDVTFTKQWMILSLARCQLEEGKYLMARQTLEEQGEHVANQDLDAVNFLIGLTYVKEAIAKPVNTSIPYWKLAYSYFSRVPMMSERYAEDRQKLIAAVEKVVRNLVATGSYQDLPFYVSMLQAWGADKVVDDMNRTIIANLNQAITDNNWHRVEELAALLNRVLPAGEMRDGLQKHFLNLATSSLDKSLIDQVIQYWSIAHLLSPQPEKESEAFAALLAAKILKLIPDDDDKLSISIPYINLWTATAKNNQARFAFAQQLLGATEQAWLSSDSVKKAELILKIASAIPQKDELPAFDKARAETVAQVYEEVTKRDDGDKLPSIFDVVNQYHIDGIDINNPAELKRNLAAAQQSLRQQRYHEALSRAEWVLRLEPDNQGAALVAGLAVYQQAHYAKAVDYLSKVGSLPPDAREALAVSEVLTGHEGTGMEVLQQLKRQKGLSNDTLLRLALGFLVEGQAQEALSWLDNIDQSSPEVTIARAYAFYLLKQYDKVAPLLAKINAPYSALDSVRGLAIQSDLEAGNTDSAEKALIKLLNLPPQAALPGMSAPFQNFELQKLSEFGRYYLAGLFFLKANKKDIAVKYFRLIKDPTPAIAIVIGRTFLAQKMDEDAIQLLSQAVNQDSDQQARVEAIPLLAQALEGKQEYIEAYEWYLKYYNSDPKTTRYRGEYARLLERLRRFDLALEQYAFLGDPKMLSPQDAVGYANALYHLGRWEEVSSLGEHLLQMEPPAPLVNQLQMARLLVNVENYKATWPLLRALPSVEKMNNEEITQVLQFLMDIGAYGQATSIASQKQQQLEESVDGLLVLAKLNEQLSRYTDALTYARLAHALAPNDLNVYQAISRYARDTNLLETLTSELEKRADRNPDNLTLRLAFASELADLGNWVSLTDEKAANRYLSDYQKAYFLLQKAVATRGDIPEVRMVMGQLLALLNNTKESIAAYRAALQLDPSYTEAYIGLASAYRAVRDDKAAIRALYQATQFAPDRADAWLRLAELYSERGDFFEASQFYQNALKHNPNNIRIYLALGNVLLQLRNPEDAKVLMEKAAELAPKNVAVLQLLLRVLTDPLLQASSDHPDALAKELQLVYSQLHAVDAAAAEKIRTQVTQRQHGDQLPLDVDDGGIFPRQ